MPRPQRHVFVCTQNRPPQHPRGSCASKGGTAVLQAFWAEQQKRQAYDQLSITYSGCLGPCDQGANVLVYPEAVMYRNVTDADVAEIFNSAIEALCDFVETRHNEKIKVIKDIAAAAAVHRSLGGQVVQQAQRQQGGKHRRTAQAQPQLLARGIAEQPGQQPGQQVIDTAQGRAGAGVLSFTPYGKGLGLARGGGVSHGL